MKKRPGQNTQGEKLSAVPPEFPKKRALEGCNGPTRTALLPFRQPTPGRPSAYSVPILTNHVLSSTEIQAEPPVPCVCIYGVF